MIPIRPYLQNAVRGYEEQNSTRIDSFYPISVERNNKYIQWMRDQGVKMPIIGHAGTMIEFTDPKSELIFILKWS